MKNLKQLSRDVLGSYISRDLSAGAVVLTAVLALAVALSVMPATAQAASQQHLPFRCFAQVGVDHVVFGPDSFFLPNTQQGPTSFTENAGPTIVTYPLYHGTSRGRDVRYVITEASVLSVAQTLGVNYAPKLAQAAGTAAVQNSSSQVGSGNGIDFPASVDFSPAHILVAGPMGFPSKAAQPGAVGQADKVVSIGPRTVSYRETDGCYDNESVHYASFDASDPGAAAIEDVTYAPGLAAAPSLGCADAAVVSANCSRESLIAFTNGQTGATNPQRQGLNAAILDGPPPLNILQEIPEEKSQFDYSPLWDVHLVQWNASIPVANRLRQTDFSTAQALVGTQAQSITPSGTTSDTFQASGFIVNCPVVSLDVNISG
jgi:hypothetical protein